MDRFPAVVIGGPPHSGKSVLTYSLTKALRSRGVDHYVLRACPDGEGDWANEADQVLVREIRMKGPWSEVWIDRMCRDVSRRHLPLIVDIGGKPTPDQERLLDYCTHAIILTPDEASSETWHSYMSRHAVPVIADLRSTLSGENTLMTTAPVLNGTLSGLERGAMATGAAFDALVDKLVSLFAFDHSDLRHSHFATSPVELIIDLDDLGRSLGAVSNGGQTYWQPAHLVQLTDYLPAATSLALYGRGPNWLYAAIARLTYPAAFYQFDVRIGWVRTQQLRQGSVVPPESPARFQIKSKPGYVEIAGTVPRSYLEYDALGLLVVPPVPISTGVILSGKLPLWLVTSLIFTYASAPWLAVYQPTLDRAVIVHDATGTKRLGDQFPLP